MSSKPMSSKKAKVQKAVSKQQRRDQMWLIDLAIDAYARHVEKGMSHMAAKAKVLEDAFGK